MAKEKPKRVLRLETEWIRAYATTYMPTESGFSYAPSALRAIDVSLVNVRHVFRNGTVVFADKLNEPGAVWIVEGRDQDERWLRLELCVISEMQSVALRDVEILRQTVENDDDAA